MSRLCPSPASQGLRVERSRASKQFGDGVFKNPTGVVPEIQGGHFPLIGEYFFSDVQRTPPSPLPVLRPHETWAHRPETGFRATWLGHSTVLLEMGGFRILTDPVFGERASPLRFAGPKRFHPVPASLSELPPIDVVVLSHDHYDHLCKPTMRELSRMNVPIVTSLGVGAHLECMGVPPSHIVELDWYESSLQKGVKLTATPSQHFSGRGIADRNKTLWSSWVIQAGAHKVFFSGDTGISPVFEEIGKAYGPFDLAMLEVGAFHASWGKIHLGPHGAAEVFQMLGGGTLLPVHWGTFALGLHAWDEPVETLVSLAETQSFRMLTPRVGEPLEPTRVEATVPWWREVLG